MTKTLECRLQLAGLADPGADIRASVQVGGAPAGPDSEFMAQRFTRFGQELVITLEAGPSAYVTAETLGEANRKSWAIAGFVTIAGLGAFEGVWVVKAIEHVHGEPSDMVAEITPAIGATIFFTPVAKAAPVAPPAPPAEDIAPEPAPAPDGAAAQEE